MDELIIKDYSLLGKNAKTAVEQGLAGADWYTCPVPKDKMRELLTRKDGPAIRDTIIWFGLLIASGVAVYYLWPSWWTVIPFLIYSVIYASSSDSHWHEALHGTAFKTDWMNNALYEIASFMVLRESTVWRWSHMRHHSDTIVVGRDPEIAVPRPANIKNMIFAFFNIGAAPAYFRTMLLHCTGRLTPAEATFIPKEEHGKVFFKARIYVVIYASVVGLVVYTQSILPLLYIGLPSLFGCWLMPIYGFTQHAGLAEDVLDHRLNCRTVYMNFINRFLYWNMNYHVEHHMFPLVPYHALPKLHEIVKSDMPTPYRSIFHAFQEIIPAVWRQRTDPGYYVRRPLPEPRHDAAHHHSSKAITTTSAADAEGWIEVCESDRVDAEDVIRFDHQKRTYAIYRTAQDEYFATDGICTHGNTHLVDGFVKGRLIECPKHNGRFDITDGSAQRAPACVALKTYKVRVNDGRIFLNLSTVTAAESVKTYSFKVVSNKNVATYIKELVLEPEDSSLRYTPGDYLQLDIPAYGEIKFSQMDINEPYASIWKAHNVYSLSAVNDIALRRNYSLATNPETDRLLRFNVRISTPPRGQACNAGLGSTYVFNLKPGDKVTAIGPFGDFHIKNTQKEMVYLGGGAGMAPLRSHISHLFETLKTNRKVSYWYGARSLQEVFYQDYFEGLAARFPNFTFHLALSEPQPEDKWTSHTGFIHDVLRSQYLANHQNLSEVEFYLCGPPPMIKAGNEMLKSLNVSPNQIAFDEFT
ncbi:MAG: NADH:ubiquinone reductase (Na(+)-transporting) subunit F [Verrucomicrobiae bacterium]|nr:NADH:ubiquinone reductase (Na(+)-transporting) subunit F [Verrucomicrobiae bacterium]